MGLRDISQNLTRRNRKPRGAFESVGRVIIALLIIFAYTAIVGRVAQKKAMDTYAAWYEADKAAAYEEQLDAEAEDLARVLYGIRGNKDEDLRTCCWCVFNRVDSEAYPDSVSGVVNQPKQWMLYDPQNPVLENLYLIAREELDRWHTGTIRPCGCEFVFLNWSSSDVCLRDRWVEGTGTMYWRWSK